MEKDHLWIKKVVKSLKPWVRAPMGVSSCPAAAHIVYSPISSL